MNTTLTAHTGTASREPGHRDRRRSVGRLVTASAIGLSALAIAVAAPAAAKGAHPGPVIDRPEPTSSLSAQNNDGGISTAPVRPAQRMAPGAMPRSQPSTSVSAQRSVGSPATAPDPAPNTTEPAIGLHGPGHRADVSSPTMPGGMTPADAVRMFGGMGAAA